MPQAVAVTCPVCGAPFKLGDEKCSFCGSYIVIKTDLPKLDRRTLNQAVIQEHILDFRTRVRSNQYDEEAPYELSLAYYSLGLVDEAVAELTHAAKLMPENPHGRSVDTQHGEYLAGCDGECGEAVSILVGFTLRTEGIVPLSAVGFTSFSADREADRRRDSRRGKEEKD